MTPVISFVENLTSLAPNVISGADGDTKEVLPDCQSDAIPAYVYRVIQNVSDSAVVYVAFGVAVDMGSNRYHKALQPGQDLNITSREAISCAGVGGAWSVSTLVQIRVQN